MASIGQGMGWLCCLLGRRVHLTLNSYGISMKITVLIATMVLWVGVANAQVQTRIFNVDSEHFKKAMDSLSGEIIIDLRTPDELKEGKIAGAAVIDFFGANFEPAIKGLDKSKTYFLYCAGGGRSSETAELMKELGFNTIYNLEEGFNGWKKKGLPVEKR